MHIFVIPREVVCFDPHVGDANVARFCSDSGALYGCDLTHIGVDLCSTCDESKSDITRFVYTMLGENAMIILHRITILVTSELNGKLCNEQGRTTILIEIITYVTHVCWTITP